MSSPSATPPDVLVLGGGGVLGEAWLNAVLAGLDTAEGFDVCGCGAYIGTSAGSIVAAGLTAGIRPSDRLADLPAPSAAAERLPRVRPRRSVGPSAQLPGSEQRQPHRSLRSR